MIRSFIIVLVGCIILMVSSFYITNWQNLKPVAIPNKDKLLLNMIKQDTTLNKIVTQWEDTVFRIKYKTALKKLK